MLSMVKRHQVRVYLRSKTDFNAESLSNFYQVIVGCLENRKSSHLFHNNIECYFWISKVLWISKVITL